jgi:hypothetical protein
MRRPYLWILPFLALLAPVTSLAVEILVLTTPTEVAYSGEPYEVQNLGPDSIWCQRGSSAGLAVGKGREVGRRESIRVAGAFQVLNCVARVAQVTGAATIVTPGIANTGSGIDVDPSCATTVADLDPYIGTSITKIDPLAKAKDFTIWPDACTYDCYGAWDPIVPSTVAPLKGFPIEAGSRVPISVGRGSALGPVRIACKGVGCHFHIMRGY